MNLDRIWPGCGLSGILGALLLLLAASPAVSAAEPDLPPLPVIQTLTEKAFAQVRNGGFITWVADGEDCYASLKKHEDIQKRVYCLQFDALAFTIESGQSEAFKNADLQASDYFTEDHFVSRQLENAPPPGVRSDKAVIARKLSNIKILQSIEEIVMKEYIRHR